MTTRDGRNVHSIKHDYKIAPNTPYCTFQAAKDYTGNGASKSTLSCEIIYDRTLVNYCRTLNSTQRILDSRVSGFTCLNSPQILEDISFYMLY